jgi:hypothetical protein
MDWTTFNKILVMLAQRQGSKFSHIWYGDIKCFSVSGVIYYRCFICQKSIGDYASDIIDHGIQHLRDANLLAFI